MQDFPYHTKETAPKQALPIFESAEKTYGMVPNLYKKMAESPALLKGYTSLSDIFSNSSLSPVEQQVVLIATSATNKCEYCVSVHSVIADMIKVPQEVTAALREGHDIPDTRLQALRKFTQSVVDARGWVDESEVNALMEHGYTRQNVLDVILGVGMKTLSNYTNHLVETELDEPFQGRAWKHGA
ncbi:MAG: carboxymuconolactone decarboxylase family protein [Gammaproteobacteria bacterium]|jgi:uncharacterized peroxidase-related enzyme|nr:carboxymuconolactone decarboxylase family protein [Gammaproteobacteria bacterium]